MITGIEQGREEGGGGCKHGKLLHEIQTQTRSSHCSIPMPEIIGANPLLLQFVGVGAPHHRFHSLNHSVREPKQLCNVGTNSSKNRERERERETGDGLLYSLPIGKAD